MALGSFHSRTHDPKVAMYLILSDYSTGVIAVLPICLITLWDMAYGSYAGPLP